MNRRLFLTYVYVVAVFALVIAALSGCGADFDTFDPDPGDPDPVEDAPARAPVEYGEPCEAVSLPADWASGVVDLYVHGCTQVAGVASCCVAARVDSAHVGRLHTRNADGVEAGVTFAGLDSLWLSDGDTQHGAASWDICDPLNASIGLHLTAYDMDPEPLPSQGLYRLLYVGFVCD